MDKRRITGNAGVMSTSNDRERPAARPHKSPRRPIQALFRRLFLINGLLFAAGTILLAISPATVSSPILLTEVPILIVGLALILGANAMLVRASLSPLDSLVTAMQRVDLVPSSDRMTERGNGDLEYLIQAFNDMVDRLQAEGSAANAHALAAQEGERQRIARELHDEIGQSLTVALLGLKRVVDRAPKELRDDVLVAQDAVRASLDEVRHVAHRLRPGVLEDLGLQSALRSLTSEFSRSSGIPTTRAVNAALPELSSDVELVIYRVAQEALTNVARHAGASHATLSLAEEGDELILRIRDDGQGGVGDDGAGIRGMRERALLITAKLIVRPADGGGTEVALIMPKGTWS